MAASLVSRIVDAMIPASGLRGEAMRLESLRAFVSVVLVMVATDVILAGFGFVRAGFALWPDAAHWLFNAALLSTALLALRSNVRLRAVNGALHVVSLGVVGSLLVHTGGLESAYVLPILASACISGLYGRYRTVLTSIASYVVMFLVVFALHLWAGIPGGTPEAPSDVRVLFGVLAVSLLMIVACCLIVERARARTSRLLRRAKDQAEEGRSRAERALRELRQAQEQMIAQERMASLGGMVAGVTHDVSTPLSLARTGASELVAETGAVRGQLAAGRLKRSDLESYLERVAELARLIHFNSDRSVDLINAFKSVSVNQSSSERRAFELAAYIDDVVASVAPTLKRGPHRVSVECPPGIVMDSYPGPLAQVLTNLIINSTIHAYDEGQGGVLSIRVDRSDDAQVRLVYSDDGKGVPHELRDRIFEPFFTTRQGRGGSGVGLHLSYQIVTDTLGGRIEVGDAEGGGARFTLTFPIQAPAPAKALTERQRQRGDVDWLAD